MPWILRWGVFNTCCWLFILFWFSVFKLFWSRICWDARMEWLPPWFRLKYVKPFLILFMLIDIGVLDFSSVVYKLFWFRWFALFGIPNMLLSLWYSCFMLCIKGRWNCCRDSCWLSATTPLGKWRLWASPPYLFMVIKLRDFLTIWFLCWLQLLILSILSWLWYWLYPRLRPPELSLCC